LAKLDWTVLFLFLTGISALDVEELLHADVCPEAGLRHHKALLPHQLQAAAQILSQFMDPTDKSRISDPDPYQLNGCIRIWIRIWNTDPSSKHGSRSRCTKKNYFEKEIQKL